MVIKSCLHVHAMYWRFVIFQDRLPPGLRKRRKVEEENSENEEEAEIEDHETASAGVVRVKPEPPSTSQEQVEGEKSGKKQHVVICESRVGGGDLSSEDRRSFASAHQYRSHSTHVSAGIMSPPHKLVPNN